MANHIPVRKSPARPHIPPQSINPPSSAIAIDRPSCVYYYVHQLNISALSGICLPKRPLLLQAAGEDLAQA
jgi:hypothetical protein